MVYGSTNFEQASCYAPIVDTNDPLKQGRVQICPPDLQNADRSKWPWVKVISSTDTQQFSSQGAIGSNPHSYNIGDNIMVNRPTASGQDWTVGYSGNPGTIGDYAQNSTGNVSDANYNWQYSPYTTQNGKKTTDQVTTAAPGVVSYNSTQPPQMTSQYKHVRDRAQQKLQNSQFQQDATRLHKKAQHIGNAVDKNKVTKLIQQKDPQGGAESSQNLQVAQMLDKARDSLNQIPGLNGMQKSIDGGLMSGLQSLIGGQLMGVFQQFMSMAQQAGQNMNNHNSNPQTNTNPYMTTFLLTENGIQISGPLAEPGAGPFPDVPGAELGGQPAAG